MDTKNLKPIKTVEQVMAVASRRGSIFHSQWRRPCAAAFIASMQAAYLVREIRAGKLWQMPAKRKAKR